MGTQGQEMKKLTDEETVLLLKEFRDDCALGNRELFARMVKSEQFKVGDQWDPGVRQYRERKGKFCLTIPLIKPTIKQVVGSQIQNPKDVTITPERSNNSTAAQIRTRMVKHAMDSEHSLFEETHWFESGLTSGMGYIGCFIDRHEDPLNGNLTIERLNEFECGIDPNCMAYDINSYEGGAKYFIWEPWVDKELVEEQYPDKKDELHASGEGMPLTDKTGLWAWLWGSFKDAASSLTGYHTEDNVSKYKYKVNHTWWRRPKVCKIVYVDGESEMNAVTLIRDIDIKKFKKTLKKAPPEVRKKVTIKDVVVNVMYHSIRVGDTLLANIEDELNGVTRFPIGVYSAYFDNGYRAGMVEDMMGTQEEINWGHSQNLQVIKHLSTYHWRVTKDATGKFKEWLEENADEDNLVIDQSEGGGKVEKAQSKPYLSGLDRFVEMAKENLKLITNVRAEDPAFDTKNMSGKAIALKQMSSQIGQAAVFKNYDYALTVFGSVVDEIINANDVYSKDEIREIVEEDDLIDVTLMAQARDQVIKIFKDKGFNVEQMVVELQQLAQGLQQNPEDMELQRHLQAQAANLQQLQQDIERMARPIAEDLLLEEIKNIRKGRYNTKVALSAYAPTSRMIERSESDELNKALVESGHPPLSRKHLIQASDVPNKEEILEEDKQLQKQMVQAVAEKQAQKQGAAA